jgi:hypothetical protein
MAVMPPIKRAVSDFWPEVYELQTAAAHLSDEHLAQEPVIAAVRGTTTAHIQKLLGAFAERRRREGFRVAGAIEVPVPAGACFCGSQALKDLTTGALFPITLDLGIGSTACKLDANGLTEACQSVFQAVSQGADLVVLSKFGKVEAEGSGFLDVFSAAAAAGIPCVTGVAPSYAAPFLRYAGGYSQWIGAEVSSLDRWWASWVMTAKAKAAE